MLYRRDFATLGAAAFKHAPFRSPLLPYRIRERQTCRSVRAFTYHRPAHGEVAGGGAKSSDMVDVQPAGSPRKISRSPRFKKGG